jgi:hypothetical protein
MGKICQMGFLNLKFETIQKKHFPVFAKKKFPQTMDEVEFFLPISKSKNRELVD